MAPAGTPDAVVQKLTVDLTSVFRQPEYAREVMGHGVQIELAGSAAFEELIKADIAEWSRIVQAGNIKPD